MTSDPKCVYFQHDDYGCESGCCGYRFRLEGVKDYDYEDLRFEFMHQKEHLNEKVKELAAKYTVPVNWEKCDYTDSY